MNSFKYTCFCVLDTDCETFAKALDTVADLFSSNVPLQGGNAAFSTAVGKFS